ncbi:MAG: B12-binding domain-containing radical SAM protein [Clostridia bacterium]|nr:B12-binding domain-containing radical SAM protein [Clostridia bacterium]
MKICLINPPNIWGRTVGSEWSENFSTMPYLGIAYIASCLQMKGYEADVYDCPGQNISLEELICILAVYKYDIIGISMFYFNFSDANRIISVVKSIHPNTFIFAGGYFATLSYETVLNANENIDCCVLGEGEYTVADIAEAVANRRDWRALGNIAYKNGGDIIQNEIKPSTSYLDQLPFPQRAFIRNKAGIVSILTSRGCYGKCSFCSEEEFSMMNGTKGIRYRSVANVVNEIEQLVKEYNPRMIRINDSNFCDGSARRKRWLREFYEAMIERNIHVKIIANTRANDVIKNKQELGLLKEVGLDTLFVGIESFVQRQLDLYNKKTTVAQNIESLDIISDLCLKVEIGFMIFEPFTTIEEIIVNLNTLKNTGVAKFLGAGQDIPSTASCYIPIERTALYNSLKEKNLLINNQTGYEFQDTRVALLHILMNEWKPKLEPCIARKYLLHKAAAIGDKECEQELQSWFRELYSYDVDFLLEAAESIKNQKMNICDFSLFVEEKEAGLEVINCKYHETLKKLV